MAYSVRFSPNNPNKYLGDPTKIFFRSLWEYRVMQHLDENVGVVGWSSEEIVIPYLSPIDNRWHRYFPDFYIKMRNREGQLESKLIEIKPANQAAPPEKRTKITKNYLKEVATWGVNEAKWNAAVEYCKDRNWNFQVLTENELFRKK